MKFSDLVFFLTSIILLPEFFEQFSDNEVSICSILYAQNSLADCIKGKPFQHENHGIL